MAISEVHIDRPMSTESLDPLDVKLIILMLRNVRADRPHGSDAAWRHYARRLSYLFPKDPINVVTLRVRYYEMTRVAKNDLYCALVHDEAARLCDKAERKNSYRAKHVAAGFCIHCTKPATDGVECAVHAAKRKDRMARKPRRSSASWSLVKSTGP